MRHGPGGEETIRNNITSVEAEEMGRASHNFCHRGGGKTGGRAMAWLDADCSVN